MFRFHIRYFLVAVILFVVEVLIALYLHDAFIRPYVGDFLVVILLYSFVKSFLAAPVLPVTLAVLLFSFLIEGLQYLNFISFLHLQHSALARAVLGTSFAWSDILAYVLGIATVLIIEKYVFKTALNRAV